MLFQNLSKDLIHINNTLYCPQKSSNKSLWKDKTVYQKKEEMGSFFFFFLTFKAKCYSQSFFFSILFLSQPAKRWLFKINQNILITKYQWSVYVLNLEPYNQLIFKKRH